jgi:hypothetical protein
VYSVNLLDKEYTYGRVAHGEEDCASGLAKVITIFSYMLNTAWRISCDFLIVRSYSDRRSELSSSTLSSRKLATTRCWQLHKAISTIPRRYFLPYPPAKTRSYQITAASSPASLAVACSLSVKPYKARRGWTGYILHQHSMLSLIARQRSLFPLLSWFMADHIAASLMLSTYEIRCIF